jgi:dephospho-CoA kinase
VIAVGCTGGIGAGKSTVVALLERRGAVVIGADPIARRLLEPGEPEFDTVVERFGKRILEASGRIDRRALGRLVFADRAELAALEQIVHPRIHEELSAALEARRGRDEVVVLELPLLAERGGRERYGLDGVLVVDAPEDLAVERLVAGRGLAAEEARERIAAQATSAERLRIADFVIVNVGTPDELDAMVTEAWRWIERLRAEGAATG